MLVLIILSVIAIWFAVASLLALSIGRSVAIADRRQRAVVTQN